MLWYETEIQEPWGNNTIDSNWMIKFVHVASGIYKTITPIIVGQLSSIL